MITLVILGFSIIVLIDFIPLVKNRDKKAITWFVIMFVSTFTLCILIMNGVEIPSLMLLAEKLIKAIGLSY